MCSSGTGQVRAAIACTKWYSLGITYERYGAWVNRWQTSMARCNTGETPKVTNGRVWHWYEGR